MLSARSLGREQLNEGSVAFGAANEVERADVTVTFLLRSRTILDDLHEQGRSFRAADAPDDVATGRSVPVVVDLFEPGVKELFILGGRADAQRFEIPAILAIMLLRERGPEFGRFLRLIAVEGESTLAQHATVGIVDKLFHDWDRVFIFGTIVSQCQQADFRIFVGQCEVNVFELATYNSDKQVPGTGTLFEAAALQKTHERGDRARSIVMQGLPGEITCGV